jgi:hypothetical protein
MKIIPKYLIGSMFITLFILYILYPEPKVIIKHPSPSEEISDIYVDDNDVYYKYHRKEIQLSEL